MSIPLAAELEKFGISETVEISNGYIKIGNKKINVLNPKLKERKEKIIYLLYLKTKIKKEKEYNVAIIGAWRGGELVEPDELGVNPAFYLLPFLLSIPPGLLLKHILIQIIIGINAILLSYIFLYIYLKNKCKRIDFITIIKTKTNNINFIKNNKKLILTNPEILGDYDIYFFKPKNICLVKDKTANALSYDAPFGNLILATTGLLAKLTPEELEAAIKHEEGHLKYHHIYKLLLFMFSEYIIRIYLINYIYINISLILIGVHLLGAALLYASLLRLYEYEADFYAKSDALAQGLLKIGWNDVVDEILYPAYSKLQFLVKSHPNTLDRVLKIWIWLGTWRGR